MGIRSDLHRHLDDALAGDVQTALIAVRRLLDTELPWLERHVVGRARRSGYSWARIARLLGRSRQAVQHRFRDHDDAWCPPPAEPGDLARRTNREARRELDAVRLRSRYREELARWDADGGDVVPW